MASHSYSTSGNLQPCHRSQSDSNLLNPHVESNGTSDSMVRLGSVGDLSPRKGGSKKKGFLYKLVRPWKWRMKRKNTGTCFRTSSPSLIAFIHVTTLLSARLWYWPCISWLCCQIAGSVLEPSRQKRGGWSWIAHERLFAKAQGVLLHARESWTTVDCSVPVNCNMS